MTADAYCITIEGELDDVAAAAFPDLHVERQRGATTLRTGTIWRLRAMGHSVFF